MDAMHRRILVIQGHPDASAPHLCHALEAAYAQGARDGGHDVRRLDVASLEFPLLRSQREWESAALPPALEEAQAAVAWAQHLVLVFPLWLGDMPALLKGFLEQIARPGFAFRAERPDAAFHKGLTGRSARVVVTMGMPASVYRWYFGAHSVKSLERNVLGFVGISPVHRTLIGMVGNLKPASASKHLHLLAKLGRQAI